MPFLDADGIERPDDTDAHTLRVPLSGKEKPFNKKRVLSKNPFRHIAGAGIRVLIWLIFTPFFKIKYGLKVENRRVLKQLKKTGVIMVGNHCHMLDVMFFGLKTLPRVNRITSIPANFQIPVGGAIIDLVGAIPIPRNSGEMRLFREAVNELLSRKKIVTFFPEGSMWPYYRDLRPFKPGAFRFAVQNNVPVLPAVTAMRVKHAKNGKKKYRMTFAFLDPVYPEANLTQGEAVEKLKDAAYTAMRRRIVSEREKDTKKL